MKEFLRFSLLSLFACLSGAVYAQGATEATCAEVIAGADGTTYRVTGTCRTIVNTKYGNWYLNDGTGEIYIYGTKDANGNYNWESLGIDQSDIVTVEGPKTTYNNTVELVDVQVIKVVKSPIKILSVSPEDGKVSAEGGTVTVAIRNTAANLDVIIPEDAKEWISIGAVLTEIDAEQGLPLIIAPNTGDVRKATIAFEATADGKKFSVETTITQGSAANLPGTVSNPFSVAQAVAKCQAIGSSSDGVIYYAKGIISSIKEVSTQYGNATFNISDDGKDENVLTCYRSYSVDNQKFTAEDEIKVGDVVIVCGKLVNYKDNTPEFSGNVYIYSLNGSAQGGTLEKPFTPAEANAFCRSLESATETDYYVKGKIVEITEKNQFTPQYGNATFYISADGTDSEDKFYVYRTLYLGNVKYTEGILPKAGDEVIICGKLTKYKDTPETLSNQSYIYSLNGETAGIETLSIQQSDGIIYNLSGQRVVTPAKGIYIKDGRKFIVK